MPHHVNIDQFMLVFDNVLWGGTDKGDNSQFWKPATIEKVYWHDGDLVADVRFHHDGRQSKQHFVNAIKPLVMDEYDKVENMKLRFEHLKLHVGKAMSGSAFFASALYDELRSDDNDEDAELVAERLGIINQKLAEVYEELHELPSQLY